MYAKRTVGLVPAVPAPPPYVAVLMVNVRLPKAKPVPEELVGVERFSVIFTVRISAPSVVPTPVPVNTPGDEVAAFPANGKYTVDPVVPPPRVVTVIDPLVTYALVPPTL